MSLTPQQIAEMDAITGLKTPDTSDTPHPNVQSRLAELDALDASQPKSLADKFKSAVAPRVADVMQPVNDIKENLASPDLSTGQKIVGTAADVGQVPLKIAGAIGGGIGDVVGAGIDKLTGGHLSDVASHLQGTPVGDAINKASQTWNDFAQKNPELASSLGDVGNLFNITGVSEAGTALKPLAKQVVKGTTETVGNIATRQAAKGVAKDLSSTIEAVNPELTGAKNAKAYAQVVKGNQTIKPAGIFAEQTLSPSQRAINVGTRLNSEIPLDSGFKLNPITLGKDHVENLNTLKTALSDTETKLQDALQQSPEINVQKESLNQNLDKIKEMTPREFGAIKDSKAVFDDVVNFGKETIAKAENNINGLRDARSTFDAQAQVEYPNAFKDGAVDVKTPAGRAIKAVRDTINEHIYNVAPNGSDLQKLVGRESDILQSTDSVAAKAAKGEGKSKLQKVEQAVKAHPIITGAAAYEGIKHTVAPGLPGF